MSLRVLKVSFTLGSYILRTLWETGGHEEDLRIRRSLGTVPEKTKGFSCTEEGGYSRS